MRIKKRIIAIVCAIALLTTMLSVDGVSAAEADTLLLNKTACVMKKGTKLKLKATVSLDNRGTARWSSSNPKVASVNWKGVVEARNRGSATIKVAVGSEKAACKIIVGTPVEKIKVSSKKVTLTEGSTARIDASVMPRKATVKALKYTSENKKVVTVNKKGIIKGIAEGSAQITVRSTDGSNKSAKVKVVVRPKESKKTEPPINVIVNVTVNVPETSYYPVVLWTEKPSGSTEKPNKSTEKPSAPTEKPSEATEKPSAPTEKPSEATEKPSAPTEKPSEATKKPSASTEKPSEATKKPSAPTEKPSEATKKPSAPTEKPSEPTATPNQTIAATGISLSETKKTLNINETAQLTVSVTPENVTDKRITWNSSDTAVATVSNKGLVTPEKEGTAEIFASTADGKYSAKCTVTVSSTAVVSTDEEIIYALSKKNLKTLKIMCDAEKKLTVPKGTYKDVDMVVNVPNGEVENNAVFKGITVQKISEDTFFENAVGNIINVLSKKSHVIIGEDASASLIISEDSTEAEVENNGSVTKLEINCEGRVDITGKSKEKIPVEIHAEAVVTTTKALKVDATDRFDITIRPGAESTVIEVDAEIHFPNIFGLGIITVEIKATGERKDVISENNGPDELAELVDFTGTVQDVDGVGIEGADIYVAGYAADYDLSGITSDNDAIHLMTDADGKYSTDDKIVSGNYYLVVKKDGYSEVSQQVIITSTYGDTYTNETITLLPAEWEGKTGSVTGKILDSVQKDLAIPGIDVIIRKGKGAVDDTVNAESVAETTTNEEGIYLVTDLEAGYYTIKLVDKTPVDEGGYLPTWLNVLIRPGETAVEGAIMSKELLDGQFRFILRWGSKQSGAAADLDAHLWGPGDYGEFHTYFSNKTYSGGESRADLDVDDMDYEGPETTTIYESAPGVYRYYVHNYTDKDKIDSTSLSESSVMVEVYDGNWKQNTYYIPKGQGNVWHVFDYDSNTNTFKTINTMYDEEDAWSVGCTVDGYKTNISSYLSSIQKYYETLEEGTGEDMPEKIAAYQQRYDALDDTKEAEAAKFSREAYRYYWDKLYYECQLWCSAEGIYTYDFNGIDNKLTIYIEDEDFEPTAEMIHARDGAEMTEITPTDSDAWKAFRVTAENGHTRVINAYIKVDDIRIKRVKTGEDSLSWAYGSYYSEDGSQYYECLYVYSYEGTDFELKDVEFTFSPKKAEVLVDSRKVDGEYTVTVKAGEDEKTWVVRKLQVPQIEDKKNTIYKMRVSGTSIYVYAENRAFSEECTFTVDGKQCGLQKQISDPGYSYYYVSAASGSYYYVYCYSMDYACSLTNISFTPNVECKINDTDHSITVTANSSYVSAEDLSLSWAYTNTYTGDTHAEYEAVSGEDYVGKVTVTMDGVSDYSNVYKVYFQPYESSEEE